MTSETLQECLDSGTETLTEYEAREVLREYDVPCPDEIVLEFEDSKPAPTYADQFESRSDSPAFPLYLKALSPDISSMSDAGGVQHVQSLDGFADAIDRIRENVRAYDDTASIDGFVASEDVSGETRELLVGATVDPQFGHVLSFGLGGRYVELYDDVEFSTIPLEDGDARDMIEHVDAAAALEEFRGMAPVDVEALVETMGKVSTLVDDNPEIQELDINPLMAGPDGVVAADALITLQGN